MLRKTNWCSAAAVAAVAANAVALPDTSAAAAQKLTAAAECHGLDCNDSWTACLIAAAADVEQPTDYPAAPNDCCHNKTVVTSLHAVDGRN